MPVSSPTRAPVAQLDRASVFGTEAAHPQGQGQSGLTASPATPDSAPGSAQPPKPAIISPQASAAIQAQADPDLALLLDAWADLPEALKAGIVAMVKAAGGEHGQAADTGRAGGAKL